MNERIKSVVEAATKLFIKQGYSKTQISHIAKAVGVSVGTIYLDFTGKDAIKDMVLKCTMYPDFTDRVLTRPISHDLFYGLENEIMDYFDKAGAVFGKRLSEDMSDYTFEAFISDIFDLLARYAVGFLFIEKNQFEFKLLSERYKNYRTSFFDTVTEYLSAFVSYGKIRPLEYPDLTATLIIETLSWWAMDIRYKTFEPLDIPLSLAKAVCIDNIVSAYKA